MYSQAFASTTTVTATVQDPLGQVFYKGTVTAQFIPDFNQRGANYLDGGVSSFNKLVSGALTAAGSFSIVVTSNATIQPARTQWMFTVCPRGSAPCVIYQGTISGGSVDISAQINANAVPIAINGNFSPGYVGTAYADSEVQSPTVGTLYYNSISGCIRAYDGTSWSCASGGGTFINVKLQCPGIIGDGVTDDSAALAACFVTYPAAHFFFPSTNHTNPATCSYFFASTITPLVPAVVLEGESNSFLNDTTHLGGTVLCFPVGVTGITLTNCGCTIKNLSILGSEGTQQLQNGVLLNLPSGANLPQWTRSNASIQRAANVITGTVTRVVGIEGLTQQVGSTIKITGVVGDPTMNGLCVITTLTGNTALGGNPNGFTCAQNGANSGPFLTDGSVMLPTTGTSASDGIRVCNNFTYIEHVSIQSFGRYAINADSLAGHGCTVPFSDDLIVRDSFLNGNQVGGYYCFGVDCNAHLLDGNAIYYNVLWGLEDQSSLGNTHIGNQISNNSHFWATTTAPPSKNVSTVSRTLVANDSVVTVVLSQADTFIKQGSCIVLSGVTDASFNTPAGQCFFITSYTDSTHYQYIQPGAPVNASSSGGTHRMAKFSEAFLSSGADDGAQKIATQSAVAQPVVINQYVEGGQFCKWGTNTLLIGGANTPGCAQLSGDWSGNFITTQGAFGLGGILALNNPSFVAYKDANGETFLRAGVTTSKPYGFTWLNFASLRAWGLICDPAGTLGKSGYCEITSQGYTQSRLTIFGKDVGGDTYLSGEGATGRVLLNYQRTGNDAGQGGVFFCSGGAAPTCNYSVSAAGIAKMSVFKSTTANPAAVCQICLAVTDIIAFRNNANNGDIQVISVDGNDRTTLNGGATATAPAVSFGNQGYGSPEIGAPATTANYDICYGDSTLHATLCSYNNGPYMLIPQQEKATDTVDLGSVATGACTAERTVAVTNAAFTNSVVMGAGTALEAGTFLVGKVSSAGNTKWQFCNLSGGAVDRASDTYTIRVIH